MCSWAASRGGSCRSGPDLPRCLWDFSRPSQSNRVRWQRRLRADSLDSRSVESSARRDQDPALGLCWMGARLWLPQKGSGTSSRAPTLAANRHIGKWSRTAFVASFREWPCKGETTRVTISRIPISSTIGASPLFASCEWFGRGKMCLVTME
jgi:hypothetical protein